MSDKPLEQAAKKLYSKLNEQLLVLGGLTDDHIKFITFFITERLGFSKFRFEVRYLESPKRFIIHLYTLQGQEIYTRPKPDNLLDEMTDFLDLKDWKIEFAKRPTNE